ncbi:MAG: hypothetical protein GF317_17490 [Candidatus Lokiarchaeota archaeon]|nr:hypothetical protein [Candidatus Lokiarchaeota archaeon]MBD3201315.1 hypothetical protein [Candidatus Lokiarchaeota archaeon]
MEDCVNVILDYYKDNIEGSSDTSNTEIWIQNAKYLISLMERTDRNSNDYVRIKNCLILLLNLCFDIKNPDHLHSKGKKRSELSNSEMQDYRNMLKVEINSIHN